MHFHKHITPVIRSSSLALFPLLIILILFTRLSTGTSANSTEILDSNSTVKNETNYRQSRQLFSLIKNIIQQAQRPNQEQQIYSQNPQSSPLAQQYYPTQTQQQSQSQLTQQFYPSQQQQSQYGLQYPLSDSGFYPQPVAEEKIQSGVSTSSLNTIPGTYPYYNTPQHQQQQLPQQYPMLNYPAQQHSSVPYYTENAPIGVHQLQKNPAGLNSPSNAGGITGLITSFLNSQNGGGGGGGGSNVNKILSKLGGGLGLPIPEDLDLSSLASLVNFGSFEGMLGKVNQFDKLQCIPRMICQMVAKRNEDAALRDSTSTTTSTTTTTRPPTTKKSKKKSRTRDEDSARFIKIDGADTALDQFVKFLDLMQLKDWSVYPYVKGMYEGNQVKRSSECASKFHSCPFSDDQLVYYFNNYNGGFFQSFRSGKYINLDDLAINAENVGEKKS